MKTITQPKVMIKAVLTVTLIAGFLPGCGSTLFKGGSTNSRTNSSTPAPVTEDSTASATNSPIPSTSPSSASAQLAVEPSTASILIGASQQFKAYRVDADGTRTEVTAQATWASSSSSVLDFSSNSTSGALIGMGFGKAAGTASVSASYANNGTNLTAQAAVNVRDYTIRSIAVTPDSATVTTGEIVSYKAIATLDDNSTFDITATASWDSSAADVMSVASSAVNGGVARALKAGDTTIRATYKSVSGQTAAHIVAAPTASVILKVNGTDGPLTITSGQTVSLSWTSDYTTTCTIPQIASASTAGVQQTQALTSDTTFTITCIAQSGHGANVTDSVTVNIATAAVQPPTPPSPVAGNLLVNQSHGPVHIANNLPVVVLWTSSGTTSCRVPQLGWQKDQANSTHTGATQPLTSSLTFNLECRGPANNNVFAVVDSVTVEVDPPAAMVSINSSWSRTPAPANRWEDVLVNWNAVNVRAGSCSISTSPNLSGGSPAVVFQNLQWMGKIRTGNTTFNLNCTALNGNPVSASTTIAACGMRQTYVSGVAGSDGRGCVDWVPVGRWSAPSGIAPFQFHFFIPNSTGNERPNSSTFAWTLPLNVLSNTNMQKMLHCYHCPSKNAQGQCVGSNGDHFYRRAQSCPATYENQSSYDFASFSSMVDPAAPLKPLHLWYKPLIQNNGSLYQDHLFSTTAGPECALSTASGDCGAEYVRANEYQYQDVQGYVYVIREDLGE